MSRRLTVLCLGLALAGVTACGNAGVEDDVEQTGMTLTVDIQGDTDVAGMRYSFSDCGDKSRPFDVQEVMLEDMTLPGLIPEFVDEPFDEHSRHLFADHFTTLEPGCYDVKVEPITKEKDLSADCQSVMAKGLQVEEGKTTEVLLISQCKGKGNGSVDVVTSLNHPPEVEQLQYVPSNDVTCSDDGNPEITFCARAIDPNEDPMKFVWEKLQGPQLQVGPDLVSSSTSPQGEHEECVFFELQGQTAKYLFQLTVFDQFYDDGNLITAEQWFEDNGYGQIKSRAELKFSLDVDCTDDDKSYPGD